jgi:glycosyltransferase involved in cell wall biosynthesis
VPEPLVSVVVPTHGRPARLRKLLQALREQSLGADRFEVIVVADGVEPTTRTLLTDQHGLQLRVIEHLDARGPAAARNAGWRAARAQLIAFTDDDCVPDREWLAAALQCAGPDSVIQGLTQPNPRETVTPRLLARTVEVRQLGPQFETCNIFYSRSVLEGLDGFDESFGLAPGGEDTDLAWRAMAAGCRPVFAPHAVVSHAVHELGVRGQLRVAARWTETIKIFARFPQTRTMLHHRIFWNVWHYLLWRSLLSLFGPRWLTRMLVTMHLRELRERAREGGGGAEWIAFLLLHDLVECWSVARGAVRYRTLVL